jgi:predicted dehydrogenase
VSVRSSPLRIGLVGCGRIAEAGYLPAIRRCAEVELVAVADPDPARRERVAALVGNRTAPRAFSSAHDLVTAGAEAAIVASPASAHLADAGAIAAAGLPCLVEKPPATDGAGAEQLARLEPPPWVGFNRRFQQGAELIPKVPSHDPLVIGLDFRYRRASWRSHVVRDDALLDLGPHVVDLALLISGSANASVRAARSDAERAEITLETGRARVRIRCATDRIHAERVVVKRPEGGMVAVSRHGGIGGALAARLRRRELPLVASLRRQLIAFGAAARGADPDLLATAEDGARAMRVIDAAREASR